MAREDFYTDINAETWDRWAKEGCEWSVPISHKEYKKALEGEWEVFLTPSKAVPKDWFPEFKGAKLLGLASGGGQQMPIFTALGADCIIFDNSQAQLDSEKMVAEREGYKIRIMKGDMTKALPFPDNYFDMIFHPVSNCYIENVQHVWDECFRILKKGGVLLSGMDNAVSFLFNDIEKFPLTVENKLPYNPLKKASDDEYSRMIESFEGVQFSHSLEEQIGGQLKAGLVITHLFEDRDRPGYGLLREYTPQYISTRAVKP